MLGSLDQVRQMVKVTGMVNAVPQFTEHPKVIDGCSEVLVEALGVRGEHARAAYGVSSLPFGAPVSIEAIAADRGLTRPRRAVRGRAPAGRSWRRSSRS